MPGESADDVGDGGYFGPGGTHSMRCGKRTKSPAMTVRLREYPYGPRCVGYGSMVFSNSGTGCQFLINCPAGPTVLSAIGVYPPHDGVR